MRYSGSEPAGADDLHGAAPRQPEDLLPLTPAVLHILLALSDQERHGYGIMREVGLRSGGRVRLGPGTLYGAIKRLLADGMVEEAGERPDPEHDDERRRYYRLTDFGRRLLGAEMERLSDLVDTARDLRVLPAPETSLCGAAS